MIAVFDRKPYQMHEIWQVEIIFLAAQGILGMVFPPCDKIQDGGKCNSRNVRNERNCHNRASYSNGQEKPSSRWSFEIGLNLTVDKFLSTVLKRLEKGYGIKDKCAALNITKFKLQASAKDFTPILPEWPKGRIFCIDSQEQWENSFPKILGHQRELVGKQLSHQCSMFVRYAWPCI